MRAVTVDGLLRMLSQLIRLDPVKVSPFNKDNGGNEPSSESPVGPVPTPAAGVPDTRHEIESLKAKQDLSERTLPKRPHPSPSSESGPVSKQPAST
jgi:hypothetical protein